MNDEWKMFFTIVPNRISLNVRGDSDLIQSLDKIMLESKGAFTYKMPESPSQWGTREDPITIYCRGTSTPELDEAIAQVQNEQEQKTVRGEINTLDNSINDTETQISATQNKISAVERNIKDTEEDIAETQAEYDKKYELRKDRGMLP